MFSSLKSRILLGFYILLIIAIPVGSYLISEERNLASKAQQPKKTKVSESTTSASLSGAKDLQRLSEQPPAKSSPAPKPSPTSSTTISFGPTLSLKMVLDGRPNGNYSTRLFVGIAEGSLTTNPKFLLSFTVDLPASGGYSELSLAGLSPGGKYTALLKGSAQIATSSAFTMSPTVTSLNEGQSINMLSGDLNDDNAINNTDYSIAKKALGTTSASTNWNENADLNKDGVVNTLDLSIISKNLGKVGASGSWVSPLPKIATSSGALVPLATDSGQPAPDGTGGYWIWVPQ